MIENLTLRDYFAVHAIVLLKSESDYIAPDRVAAHVYAIADAMLIERAKVEDI